MAIESHAEERAYVLNKIQDLAVKAFPGSKPVIKVFGSLMTGLALISSDMDMAVTGLTICDRASMIDDMHSLADQLRKWDLIADLKAIETASIPVIKANISLAKITKEMGKVREDGEIELMLPIDITFDDSPPDGSNGA
jgi:DNA polymerase sigma